MTDDARIDVHHLTRVEGHGDIHAEIRDGRLQEARFAIVEAPRFFEGFLRGHPYDEVVHMASRICGICAVSHSAAALKATERAFGVEISEQTRLLRRLAYHGEVMSSHILHIYYLAAPDFLDLPSVLPLIETDKDLVLRAMRLKELAYDICKEVVGRHTHPVSMQVGGFSMVHQEKQLLALRERLQSARDDMEATVKLFRGLELPDFDRETEYVSLTHPSIYPFYEGQISSSVGETIAADSYREAIKEYVVPYSTAKHARWNEPHYLVGALARVNNNYEQLRPFGKWAVQTLGMPIPCHNPFMMTVAQVVECAHCIEDAIAIIDTLVETGIDPDAETAKVEPKAATGVGVVEAPRGILFHEYQYDTDGKCRSANHIIPTAQNLANLEADMREYIPRIQDRSEDDIRRQLEMLVRAYDPCISCSTHMVTVNLG